MGPTSFGEGFAEWRRAVPQAYSMIPIRPVMGATPARAMWAPAFVLAVWGLAVAPAVLGLQPCLVARFLRIPCPSCGTTRALGLFFAGHVEASVRMHPLAIPLAASFAAIALSTAMTALTRGSAGDFHRPWHGRAALVFFALVYVAAIALWIARFFGAFGGPVPV